MYSISQMKGGEWLMNTKDFSLPERYQGFLRVKRFRIGDNWKDN